MASCAKCGDELDPGGPIWQTLCRDCFRMVKRNEQDGLLRRVLEAEHKVELAKTVVLELQSRLRAAEGRVRAAQGKVGVGHGPPVSGALGLDLATLQRMRRLCHPDKHGGNEAAVQVSQVINGLIDQAKP
jgi:hypothetical protein